MLKRFSGGKNEWKRILFDYQSVHITIAYTSYLFNDPYMCGCSNISYFFPENIGIHQF